MNPGKSTYSRVTGLFLCALCALCARQLPAAVLIGNGLVGTTGNGLNAPLVLIPSSNPLILSNGNVSFGVNYSIPLVNGAFSNQVVAGNYTLKQGPYSVSIQVQDTTNVVYLTNCFTSGLASNYVYSAAPAVYGTKADSNDVVAGFLLAKLLNTPGITWSVTNANGYEQVVLTDTSGGFSGAALTNLLGVTSNALYTLEESGGFSGAALTNWIGALSTNATNFTLTLGFNETNFAQAIGQALTNWNGVLSTNFTNFAQMIGTTVSNWSGVLSTNATNFAQALDASFTNWVGVLSTNSTNYAAAQASAAQSAAIAVAGILSTNATNDIVTTSNILYSFVAGGGFSGLALTNWIGVLSTNATNFAQAIGQALTNWDGVLSTNGTNWTITEAQAASNYAGILSTNATNWAGTLSTNGTNFAQGIGTTITNWAPTLTNVLSLIVSTAGSTLTNWTGVLSTNATNFAQGIGTTISNYAQAGNPGLSNFVSAGDTLPAASSLTNSQLQGGTTNLGQYYSWWSNNFAVAASSGTNYTLDCNGPDARLWVITNTSPIYISNVINFPASTNVFTQRTLLIMPPSGGIAVRFTSNSIANGSSLTTGSQPPVVTMYPSNGYWRVEWDLVGSNWTSGSNLMFTVAPPSF